MLHLFPIFSVIIKFSKNSSLNVTEISPFSFLFSILRTFLLLYSQYLAGESHLRCPKFFSSSTKKLFTIYYRIGGLIFHSRSVLFSWLLTKSSCFIILCFVRFIFLSNIFLTSIVIVKELSIYLKQYLCPLPACVLDKN